MWFLSLKHLWVRTGCDFFRKGELDVIRSKNWVWSWISSLIYLSSSLFRKNVAGILKETISGLVLRYVKSLCSFASLSLVELSTRSRLVYFLKQEKSYVQMFRFRSLEDCSLRCSAIYSYTDRFLGQGPVRHSCREMLQPFSNSWFLVCDFEKLSVQSFPVIFSEKLSEAV